MKKRLTTILLSVIVVVLLGSIAFVSYSLRNTTDTAPTVAKKTKAAAITYNRIIPLSTSAPQPTQLPIQAPPNTASISPLPTVNLTPPITQEPVIASVSPTIIGAISISPAATTAPQTLPDTGFVKYSYAFVIGASALIFLSFLF